MVLLSVIFFIFGIGRLIDAFSDDKLNKFAVIAKFLTGLLASIMGIIILSIIIIYSTFSIIFLINLFALVLLIIGIVRIVIGILVDKYSMEYRILLIIVGILSFIVSLVVLFLPPFNYYISVLMISLTLLINGLARVFYGLYEKK